MASDWSILLRPTPRKILGAMLGGASSLTELARATRMSKPALIPWLKALAALGVVRHERVPTPEGTEARYHLQDASLHVSVDSARGVVLSWASASAFEPDLPLLGQVPQPEVRAEVATFLRALGRGAPDVAADAAIVLFGSGARGDATWKSDIDLIVLTDAAGADVAVGKAAFETDLGSQHAIRPLVASPNEFAAARKRIFQEAAREGIIVWAPRGENAPWSRMDRYKRISL